MLQGNAVPLIGEVFGQQPLVTATRAGLLMICSPPSTSPLFGILALSVVG
jgi:hypothetical protein